MISLKKHLLVIMSISITTTAMASTAIDELLQSYKAEGATQFSAEAGKAFWSQKFYSSSNNQQRSCSTCHTTNLTQAGKHAVTGKEIKPLAPSVMSKRLTNPTKISKWLRRNCSWTVGRECTAQEKGNVLMYLKDQ